MSRGRKSSTFSAGAASERQPAGEKGLESRRRSLDEERATGFGDAVKQLDARLRQP